MRLLSEVVFRGVKRGAFAKNDVKEGHQRPKEAGFVGRLKMVVGSHF